MTAYAGRDVRITCNTSRSASVAWWFQRQGGSDNVEMYVSGKLKNGCQSRCQVVSSSSYIFELIKSNLTVNDSGLYTCTEDSGFGAKHQWELFVSGKIPCLPHYVYYYIFFGLVLKMACDQLKNESIQKTRNHTN